MSDVKSVVLKGWETQLREWYDANKPKDKLIYHYCERMTACSAPMSSELFSEIYKKLTDETSKVKAVKLTMTFGVTMCKPSDQLVKELGRMQAWQNAKMIDLWVRQVSIVDNKVTLYAFEEMDGYGGHIRMEFTRWRDGGTPRSFLRGLPELFTRAKSYNEKWRRGY